jgi:hypothetical protein
LPFKEANLYFSKNIATTKMKNFEWKEEKNIFLSPKQNVVWKIENEKNENENAEQENFSLLLRETGP